MYDAYLVSSFSLDNTKNKASDLEQIVVIGKIGYIPKANFSTMHGHSILTINISYIGYLGRYFYITISNFGSGLVLFIVPFLGRFIG